MVPAHERFGCDQPAGVRVDDRLVEDLELPRLQALTDPDGGLQA